MEQSLNEPTTVEPAIEVPPAPTESPEEPPEEPAIVESVIEDPPTRKVSHMEQSVWLLNPVKQLIHALGHAQEHEEATLKVQVRADQQHGVFTRTNINKAQFVCEYAGQLMTKEEADKLEVEYQSNGEGCYIYI